MKWVVKEDIGVAKLYNDEFTKDLLTLYWGKKWGMEKDLQYAL